MMPPTAHWIEFVPFVAACIGVCSSAYGVHTSLRDLTILHVRTINGALLATVQGRTRRHLTTFIVLTLFAAASGYASFVPPPPPAYVVSSQGMIMQVAIVTAIVLLALGSAAELYEGRRVKVKIRSVQAERVHATRYGFRRITDKRET